MFHAETSALRLQGRFGTEVEATIPHRGIVIGDAMSEITYSVPDMSCAHCEHAVSSELLAAPGVESVDVDLGTKLVVVRGDSLDDAALRAAIEEAGYEAAR
jgi:copper chaperone